MSEIAAKAVDDFGARTSPLRCLQGFQFVRIKWILRPGIGRLEIVIQVNNSKRVNLKDE
jgi:hypothetical protein